MTLHTQVIFILLAGLAILYVVFFTDFVINRRRLRSLPPRRRTEAIPYTAFFCGGHRTCMCVVFSRIPDLRNAPVTVSVTGIADHPPNRGPRFRRNQASALALAAP